MSPARFHHQHNNNILNGPRPSPLKINKESHLLHKPSSSSLSSSISVIGGGVGVNKHMEQKNPVIIYMHSPKVIHTQARDFMALVQKLTGFSSSENHENALIPTQQQEQKESSSVSRNTGGDVSPILNPPKNPYFADIPLFTPTAVELGFFCSPRPSVYTSPPAGISPPVFEFMKGLPES